jgi:hypothetical protein
MHANAGSCLQLGAQASCLLLLLETQQANCLRSASKAGSGYVRYRTEVVCCSGTIWPPMLLGTTYPRFFPPGNFKLDRTWVI